MTGQEHYDKAEELRARAVQGQQYAYDSTDPGDVEHGWRQANYYNAAAQVHATLALADATAQHVEATRKQAHRVGDALNAAARGMRR